MMTGMRRALWIILLGACCAEAQIPAGQLHISGTIPKSGLLSLAPSPAVLPLESTTGSTSTRIRVRVRPSSGNPMITIPLIARSNSAYRLIVKSGSPEDSEPVRVAIRSVDPIAGGTHLMPDATNIVAGAGELTRPSDQIVLGTGPRISRGGNNSTIDNAILVALDVELPNDAPETELIFIMEFGL